MKRSNDIDLGLAILAATTEPNVCRTHREIAAYCGCSHTMIEYIEQRALHKLRNKIFFVKDPVLIEAMEQVTGKSKL